MERGLTASPSRDPGNPLLTDDRSPPTTVRAFSGSAEEAMSTRAAADDDAVAGPAMPSELLHQRHHDDGALPETSNGPKFQLRPRRSKEHGSDNGHRDPLEEEEEPDGLMNDAAGSNVFDEGNSDFWQTFAGVAGNVLEWYDFAVFGFLDDVIGDVFFPPNSEGDASAFLVFGGAFIMRPIGGLLLGWLGDTVGRKKALVVSIFLMAFPTFAMGCLPGYSQIGNWAVVLLIIVRLLQGLSVGGQLMSSLVFTLENHDPGRWGLFGSFVMAAANL